MQLLYCARGRTDATLPLDATWYAHHHFAHHHYSRQHGLPPLALALALAVALARPRTRTRSTYQHGVLPAPTVRRGGSGAVEVRGCGVP